MVLAFDSTGKFGESVFGNTSSQTAGANGAIVQHNPSTTAPVAMTGGKRQNKSKRQSKSKRQNQRQNGGKNKRQSKRRNQSKKQRGGK